LANLHLQPLNSSSHILAPLTSGGGSGTWLRWETTAPAPACTLSGPVDLAYNLFFFLFF
jgi:hypothetical protein